MCLMYQYRIVSSFLHIMVAKVASFHIRRKNKRIRKCWNWFMNQRFIILLGIKVK